MSRIGTFSLTVIVAGIVVSSMVSAAETPSTHVLFITIDDLNDWVGCLKGHPQASTPNIDRLAARGILFTNAHCAAPECNPSRTAVLTGKMPEKTGVWSNRNPPLRKPNPHVPLLPETFADAGYLSFGAGKILHVGGRDFFGEYRVVEQRWSPLTLDLIRKADDAKTLKPDGKPRKLVKHKGRRFLVPVNGVGSDRPLPGIDGDSFDWGPFDLPDSAFGDTQITDWAIQLMLHGKVAKASAGGPSTATAECGVAPGNSESVHDNENPRAKPFFLAVGYYRPHVPMWGPKRFFERFRNTPAKRPAVKADDFDDLGGTARKLALDPWSAGSHEVVVKHKQWEKAVAAYLACTSYVDHEIGRLLDAFDKSHLRENTIIVLWSDHGWHLGEKQHWGKWTGWERSTRVPLIIVPPRRNAKDFAAAGTTCSEPVSLIDLYPTLAEFCGVQAPADLDGRSLIPLLKNPKRKTNRVVRTQFGRGNHSLRTDRWRYIRYADGSEELYDLQRDPHEWDNLARKPGHRHILERMAHSRDGAK